MTPRSRFRAVSRIRHSFWIDKGIDTTKLKKTLEEGKSKLVISNANVVSEYDVDGYSS